MHTNSSILLILPVICCLTHAPSSAQEPTKRPKDIDVEFVMEQQFGGKKGGGITHRRNTGEMAKAPLVNTFSGSDNRSAVVTIGYVGYADFKVVKGAEDQLQAGHVFSVQVFSGKKGVTVETAEKNVSKLVVFGRSSQVLYKDEDVTVTIRKKKK